MTITIQKCKKPWYDLIILSNGDCINCHFQDRKYSIGNINNTRIKEIWNSKEIKNNREKMSKGEIPDICKTGMDKCEFLR